MTDFFLFMYVFPHAGYQLNLRVKVQIMIKRKKIIIRYIIINLLMQLDHK